MQLKRKSSSTPPSGDRTPQIMDRIPIVDADLFIYSCGMAGQYTIKHFYPISEKDYSKPRKGPIASFRYVNGDAGYKTWLAREEYTLDEDVFFLEEEVLDPIVNILHSVKMGLQKVQDQFGNKPVLYITGKDNFREGVAKEIPYKGNRASPEQRATWREEGKWIEWLDKTEAKYKQSPRPKHKQAIIDYMVKHWDATVIDGMEADDACCIHQWKDWDSHQYINKEQDSKTCIVHVDKDLNMLPGWHFNPHKGEPPYYVDELMGWKFFYKQVLTGDSNDNIPGLFKVGPAKANKLIDPCNTLSEMYGVVFDTYKAHPDFEGKDDDYIAEMIENRGELLWMLREDRDG